LSNAHIVYRLYSVAGIECQTKTVTFFSPNLCYIINRVQSSFPDHTVFTANYYDNDFKCMTSCGLTLHPVKTHLTLNIYPVPF